MRTITLKGLVGVLVLASTAFVVSACNTTKATVDTFAKFTSSTSPGEWIDADGVITDQPKGSAVLPLSRTRIWNRTSHVGMENIITSMAVLMRVPRRTGQVQDARSGDSSVSSVSWSSSVLTAGRQESMLATSTTVGGKTSEPMANKVE